MITCLITHQPTVVSLDTSSKITVCVLRIKKDKKDKIFKCYYIIKNKKSDKMTEIARQLEAKEFRDKNYKQNVIYIRYANQIILSEIFGYSQKFLTVMINKDGSFDFKIRRGPQNIELKKGLKNTLIEKYNYESIMDAVENKNKSDLENFKYIILLISIYSKIVGEYIYE